MSGGCECECSAAGMGSVRVEQCRGGCLETGLTGMKCDSAGHAEVVAFYLEAGSHGRGAEGLDVTTCVPPNSHSSCYRDNKQTVGRPEQRRGEG